jgi:hypothetical protein
VKAERTEQLERVLESMIDVLERSVADQKLLRSAGASEAQAAAAQLDNIMTLDGFIARTRAERGRVGSVKSAAEAG